MKRAPFLIRRQATKDDQPETSKQDEKSEKESVVFPPQAVRPNLDNLDDLLSGGGRPGAIVETEEQLERKQEIWKEVSNGVREYPDWVREQYGEPLIVSGEGDEEGTAFDTFDDDGDDEEDWVDAGTLGTWGIQDLKSKFDYEWDPDVDPDPNVIPKDEAHLYVSPDEEFFDPMFGPSNPIDERTKVGSMESYMISDQTRDDSMLTPQFKKGDLEQDLNDEFVQFRKSLEVIETYVDPFLEKNNHSDLHVPRHVAKWYGYPELMEYPEKNYTNNRFTPLDKLTNFDALEPYRARQLAVEMARAKNAEWMPDGMSQAWHMQQRQVYDDHHTLVGTLRAGDIDEAVREQIQPALKVLGSIVDLLSMQQTEEGIIFRFHYKGLMKNKHGMACWARTMLEEECGVQVANVIFETGFRRRDPVYDGGSHWDGPHN